MKNIRTYFLMAILVIGFASCEEIELPDFDLIASNVTVKTGEEVTFTFIGEAEVLSIYTGDDLHKYVESYEVITSGKKLDQEITLLPQANANALKQFLTDAAKLYNDTAKISPIDINAINKAVDASIDVEYYSIDAAKYAILLPMVNYPFINVLLNEAIKLYYNVNKLLLKPESGFSTGFPVDRYQKSFSYKYSKPGTYTVTGIAVNVGYKEYSGSGYKEDRIMNATEYKIKPSIKEIKITVNP